MNRQRFGVKNLEGARSSEWVVVWDTAAGDVYLLARTLGGAMKVSLHASGRCHVRAPEPRHWRGIGPPPAFLDTWDIDPASGYAFPFAVVFPEQELRVADWGQHRDKGTVWIEVPRGKGVEVAVFLVRASGDVSRGLVESGWKVLIVDALLGGERRLIVAGGYATVPDKKLAELDAVKAVARTSIANMAAPVRNSRMLLLAGANEGGTRKFVEAAVLP